MRVCSLVLMAVWVVQAQQNKTYSHQHDDTRIIAKTLQVSADALRPENRHVGKLGTDDKTSGHPHVRGGRPWPLSIRRDVEARLLDMAKRHPHRRELQMLPGVTRFKKDDTQNGNTSLSSDCPFLCPNAESLAPCTCHACTRAINCSAVDSLEQLFNIFHTTVFPDTSFESFVLVSPLRRAPEEAARSGVFLANTFGDASFASIWVESLGHLTAVEAGAFKGSEATLTSLVFKWNYQLKYFPFTEIGNMKVLEKLQVSGSRFTSLPAFPAAPKLTKLFLDNNLIASVPPETFAQLSSLLYLDLAFNSLAGLQQGSLHFVAPYVMAFIDHNTINAISQQTFSGHQPTFLDVSYNDLTGLDQKLFQPILDSILAHHYDSYVDATHNPLQCAHIAWLVEDAHYLALTALPDLPCLHPH